MRAYEEIPTLLYAYQELQQPRARKLEALDNDNFAVRSMPPGPERDARDAAMKEFVKVRYDPWRDDDVSRQWWKNYEVWAYDTYDTADDWWTQWKELKSRSVNEGANFDGSGLPVGVGYMQIQVVEVTVS